MPAAGRFQQALREIEKNFLGLLEAAPEPVVIYDIQVRAIYINPAFAETFGWSLDELFGKRVPFIPEDRLSETDNAIGRILAGEKVTSFETKRLTKDGKTLDVRMGASLFHDQKN